MRVVVDLQLLKLTFYLDPHVCKSLYFWDIRYLNEQKLPTKMLRMQTGIESDEEESEGGEDVGRSCSSKSDSGDEGMLKFIKTCPFNVGTLRVISLGDSLVLVATIVC